MNTSAPVPTKRAGVLRWVFANVVAFAAILLLAFVLVADTARAGTPPVPRAVALALGGALMVGTAHWLAVRRRSLFWWVVTAFGAFSALILRAMLPGDVSPLAPLGFLAAVSGGTVGVIHWVMLGGHFVDSIPWVVASAIGWTLALMGTVLPFGILPAQGDLLGLGQREALSRIGVLAGWGALAGISFGLITGVFLPLASRLPTEADGSLPAASDNPSLTE